MKVTRIGDIFDSIISNNLSAVLISGSWGIGKTYAITEYLKSKKYDKKHKYIYCSVFGKTNIGDLNSEIYYKLYPAWSKFVKFASVASRLIKVAPTFLGASVEVNPEAVKSAKKVKNYDDNKQVIVIIDDFERRDPESIKTDSFLGYINSLIDDGIKIVVCSNLEKSCKIDATKEDDNLLANTIGEYAEKVFDRTYFIEEADSEIIYKLLEANFWIHQSMVFSIEILEWSKKQNACVSKFANG